MTRSLKASELGFGILFESLRDAVVVGDIGLDRVVLWNQAAARIFGYTAEEATSLRLVDLVPERLQERYLAWVNSREPLEVPGLRKDGSEIWVEMTLDRVRDASVTGAFLVAVIRDVSRRHRAEARLEQREAQLKEAEEIAHIGHWEWNLDTSQPSWSEETFRIYGIDVGSTPPAPHELLGLIHPGDRARVSALLEHWMRSPEPLDIQYRILRRTEVRHLHVRGRFVQAADGQRRLIGSTQDVTEWVDAQAKLERINRRLLQTDRYKDALVGFICHELKNPLGAILGATQLLKEDLAASSAADQTSLLDLAIHSCQWMEHLVRDLIDYAAIQEHRLSLILDSHSNMQLVHEAVKLVQFSATDREIKLDLALDKECVLRVDGRRVIQVLVNLLSNAIKYGPVRSTVRVRTGIEQDGLRFEVEDEGPGIDEARSDQLFGKFERLDAPAAVEGSGLGLSIAKALVEAHGGSIGVRRLERGGFFWFWLPLTR